MLSGKPDETPAQDLPVDDSPPSPWLEVEIKKNQAGDYPEKLVLKDDRLDIYYPGQKEPTPRWLDTPLGLFKQDRILEILMPVDDLKVDERKKCLPSIEIEECTYEKIRLHTQASQLRTPVGSNSKEYAHEIPVELKSDKINARLHFDGRGETGFRLKGLSEKEAQSLHQEVIEDADARAAKLLEVLALPGAANNMVLRNIVNDISILPIGKRPTKIDFSAQENATIEFPSGKAVNMHKAAQQEMEKKMKPVVALPGKENSFAQLDMDALNAPGGAVQYTRDSGGYRGV